MKIPLPPLSEQNRIIKEYNKKIKLAEEQEKKADKIERNIDKSLLEQLGVKNLPSFSEKKKFRFISFRDIERWDVWISQDLATSNLYETIQLQSIVLGKPVYGANVKGIKKKSVTRYIRITDINENGFLNDEIVSPEFVEEKYLLKHNDFLIARSGNTVGKTFLYKEEFGRAIYAGYLVKYNLDTNKILPEYLLHYTKSSIFKRWIEANQRVSGQPNINGQEFLQSPVILPSFKIQRKIVNTVAKMKSEVKKLKQQAEQNRIDAIKEFEREVFLS